MSTYESAASQETNALGSWADFFSEALTIKAAGYLNEQREKAGIYQTSSSDQMATRTNNDGSNLTGQQTLAQKSANWLMIGGFVFAGLIVVVVLVELLGGKKGGKG